MRRLIFCFFILCLLLPAAAPAEFEIPTGIAANDISLFFSQPEAEAAQEVPQESSYPLPASTPDPTEEIPARKLNKARTQFIDSIIELSRVTYEKTGGHAQRAHESGDIYICKNYTIYLFRQNAGKYRMEGYPQTKLILPDNLPRAECAPYAYGICWKDVPAKDGNPFYIADQFLYDDSLSEAENRARAAELLMHVERGDFFQMSAEYRWGIDAHSLIFMSDYDLATNTVHWTDSNMRGTTIDGERYGYVQYDVSDDISFFVDAICHPKRGATLYRLYDDIVAR